MCTAQYIETTITEVDETPIAASDLVNSENVSYFFKNFKVEDSQHLAHVAFTRDMLYGFENTGTIFKSETGTEDSELYGTHTSVTKTLGRGGCRFKYSSLKNSRLVTRVDFIPTYSIHVVAANAAMLGYTYSLKSWEDGSTVGSSTVNVGDISRGGTKGTVAHFGSYYRVVLHINDNGTERTCEKVVNCGLTNSVAGLSISSISSTSCSFSSELVAMKLSKNAYTTRVDVMEATSSNPTTWCLAVICGIKFYVDSINHE